MYVHWKSSNNNINTYFTSCLSYVMYSYLSLLAVTLVSELSALSVEDGKMPINLTRNEGVYYNIINMYVIRECLSLLRVFIPSV